MGGIEQLHFLVGEKEREQGAPRTPFRGERKARVLERQAHSGLSDLGLLEKTPCRAPHRAESSPGRPTDLTMTAASGREILWMVPWKMKLLAKHNYLKSNAAPGQKQAPRLVWSNGTSR